MIKKLIFGALFLSAVLLCWMPGVCFADVSKQFEQAEKYVEDANYVEAEAMYKQIVTEYPGTDPYPNCVAGADCGIKIDTQPEGQYGDVKRDLWNVPPDFLHKSKTWYTEPDMHCVRSDLLRTWDVYTTEIEFWVRIGVASNAEEICCWFTLPCTICPGSYVNSNNQKIDSVEVEELDGTFEIVP